MVLIKVLKLQADGIFSLKGINYKSLHSGKLHNSPHQRLKKKKKLSSFYHSFDNLSFANTFSFD